MVIGSFGLPNLIELQIRLIHDNCGIVPILIVDDCSDGYQHTPDSSSAFGKLCEFTRKYPSVSLWSNPQRIGHAGGDLAKVWVGLQWAKTNGLRVIATLSQRFMIDRKNWLADGARELLESGMGTASNLCREGHFVFPIRSEAMLLDVEKWYTADVLNHLRPRVLSLHDPRVINGIAAEIVYWDDIKDRIDPPGKMHKWSILGEDRCKPVAGITWHCSHSRLDYERLAKRFGIELDSTFDCAGWQAKSGYKW